jgi:hypothetical protein
MISFLEQDEDSNNVIIDSDVLTLGDGWYELESDIHNFRWSSLESTIKIDPTNYREMILCYNGGPTGSNKRYLDILLQKGFKRTFPIISDSNTNDQFAKILLSNKSITEYTITINEQIHKERDSNDIRELGIKLYSITLVNNQNESLVIPIHKIQSTDEYLNDTRVLNEKFNSSTLNITMIDQFNGEYKGVLYFGQYGTCGYAVAAKGYLYDFFKRHIPVTWFPLYFENTTAFDKSCEYNLVTESLINKEIDEIDTVILHCTPDIWYDYIYNYNLDRPGIKLIGFVAWESDTLPDDWVEYINNSVHELRCPSNYNKTVFESNGVTIPITVVPHVFLKKALYDTSHVNLLTDTSSLSNDKYTFYNISEYTARKGVGDLIKTFCESFTLTDNVRLILKVHYKDYSDKNIQFCIDSIEQITSQYDNPPEINVLVNRLTEAQILMLHSIGNCYVSLTKSEGFGLPIFDAYNYMKDVIVTGHGGHVDFLGNSHDGLINYTIDNVKDMEDFSHNYSEEQRWAYPDLSHASKLMVEFANRSHGQY